MWTRRGSAFWGVLRRSTHATGEPRPGFEEEGLALLWPYLEARIRQEGVPLDLLEKTDRPYECWSRDDKRERNNIHIDNLYRPKSPLSDMFIPFAASLIRLLRDAQAELPGIEMTHCSTWMNSSPKFQTLFPRRWMENAEAQREIGYTYGYWGQFMDRMGDFHARNGSKFRETGELPFPSLGCECLTEEVLAHLESHFPEAVRYNAERDRATDGGDGSEGVRAEPG
ncbi:MAG: hypothetical protein EXS64_04715 [Candidatus Latescibacteria bacterium]|nr:hypothetical protein [Candidatus Latescibacterota bacterium]